MSADGRAADPVIEAPADRAVVWPEATRPETPSASLRLSGPLLSAAQWLSKMPASAPAVRVAAREMLGLGALARLPEAFRGSPPDDPRPRRARPPRRWDDARHSASRAGDGPADLQQYRDAYASGRATPEGVATAALEALMSLSRRSPRMNVSFVVITSTSWPIRRSSRRARTTWMRSSIEGRPSLRASGARRLSSRYILSPESTMPARFLSSWETNSKSWLFTQLLHS